MWLLPVFSGFSRLATAVFYRRSVAGREHVPRTGPVLLVANHPNSLIDPMLVVAVAHRPVRFLAKAPLFTDRLIGWAVRASGSIPVYRQVDDPDRTGENVDMFRAVHRALEGGAAVGIFPEGVSHSDPSLAPLKTGAARIALGARPVVGGTFPIVPVGMVLRDKSRFRSECHVILGAPVPWDDLREASVDDRNAVRALTDRIDDHLRNVTVNLERWEDQPLVECVEQIWDVERAPASVEDRVARTRTITTVLADLRAADGEPGTSLRRRIGGHVRRLDRLRLTPEDLHADTGIVTALRWTVTRFLLLGLPALVVGAAGRVAWLLPFLATDRLARLGRPLPDQVSTHKLLYGLGTYLVWWIAATAVVGFTAGPLAALVTLVGLPTLGISGLWARDRWVDVGRDLRRFLALRRRRRLVADLRDEQRQLAEELDALYREWTDRRSAR